MHCIADNRISHILAGALPMTNFDESVNSFVDDRIWEQIEQSNCHHCFAFSVLSWKSSTLFPSVFNELLFSLVESLSEKLDNIIHCSVQFGPIKLIVRNPTTTNSRCWIERFWVLKLSITGKFLALTLYTCFAVYPKDSKFTRNLIQWPGSDCPNLWN